MIAEELPFDSGITTGKDCIDRLIARMSQAGLEPDGKCHALGFILTARDEQARGVMLQALEKVKFF